MFLRVTPRLPYNLQLDSSETCSRLGWSLQAGKKDPEKSWMEVWCVLCWWRRNTLAGVRFTFPLQNTNSFPLPYKTWHYESNCCVLSKPQSDAMSRRFVRSYPVAEIWSLDRGLFNLFADARLTLRVMTVEEVTAAEVKRFWLSNLIHIYILIYFCSFVLYDNWLHTQTSLFYVSCRLQKNMTHTQL